jgi:prepilin-type N-terminal cleavage/methylation domain-containing protein
LKKGRLYVIFKAPSTKHQAPSTKHFKLKGFTLSELLVSLGVLGLIAGLTIPTIVNAVETSKRKALFRETVQIVAQVVQQGVLSGELTPDDAGETYMIDHLNATKVYPTEACVENNWLYPLPYYRASVKDAILNNGVILSFGHWTWDYQMVYVKLPGNADDNYNYVCYNATQETTSGYCGTIKSGMVAPHEADPYMTKKYHDLMGNT